MAENKTGKFKRFMERLQQFLNKDIWSLDLSKQRPLRRAIGNSVKVIVIAIRTFIDDKVMTRAAALTYSTLFAIVPILALIFAIARGFGFENIVTGLLKNGIIDQNDTVDTVMKFIDQYLQYASSGAFIGIGLLFLLFSVFSLADGIETNLNSIWHVKKARGMGRKITDYFSLLLLIPIGIICLSGLSVLASSIITRMEGFLLLGGFLKFLIKAMPYLLAGLILTGFYMFMPNTKVKFKYAIIPGIIAGCLFQMLQNLYFHGQFSLSSYNAIYGGFAALPLFLLWCYISWSIILFGCQMAYVSQNNDNFNYFKEPDKISRRHEDFYCLMVMSCICKRFNRHEPALTMKDIVNKLQIPHRYVISSLDTLTDAGLLETVLQNDDREPAYVPSTDTQSLTVVKVLSALNSSGYCDLDHALDNNVRDSLLKIDNERKHLSGDIWNTPVSDL
ncbi:MAG: YihY/virulence factor BrkB family protein [Bacteroidaceae bacterium]|nr:YihY/virulence factor BrkB family protein [Bacteroidaceae bacterium]